MPYLREETERLDVKNKHVDYIHINSHNPLYMNMCIEKANKVKDLPWLVAT